jgi:hypothetical protein
VVGVVGVNGAASKTAMHTAVAETVQEIVPS